MTPRPQKLSDSELEAGLSHKWLNGNADLNQNQTEDLEKINRLLERLHKNLNDSYQKGSSDDN